MSKKYQRINEQGYTLVELLIVMVLLGILSVAVSNFIADWLQASSRAEIRSSLLLSSENAMDKITSDIRLSGSVDTTPRWPDTYSSSYGGQSGANDIILAKIATDVNNNVIFTNTTNYTSQKDDEIYYLSGTTLYRRTLDSNSSNDVAVTTCPPAHASSSCPADDTVATGVSNISFTYYNASNTLLSPTPVSNLSNATSVQISITISQMLDAQTFSETYSTRMVFRNG